MTPRALVCAAALLLAGCRTGPEEAARTPDFLSALRLPPVGATPYDWRELQGRVVLVSFVATWSFPAIAWLPTLEALQKEYGARGLRVVLVGVDQQGARVLTPFVEHYALTVPVLVADAALLQGKTDFGPIQGVPSTFLLDKRGQAAGGWQGMASHEALSEAVETLLQR